jgi:hypothetical protein
MAGIENYFKPWSTEGLHLKNLVMKLKLQVFEKEN